MKNLKREFLKFDYSFDYSLVTFDNLIENLINHPSYDKAFHIRHELHSKTFDLSLMALKYKNRMIHTDTISISYFRSRPV